MRRRLGRQDAATSPNTGLRSSFWRVFLAMAIIGTITWLAIFEHNYHPRIYRWEAGLHSCAGSVKPDKVDDLMREPDIDGTLVGGASLKAEGFTRVVRFR